MTTNLDNNDMDAIVAMLGKRLTVEVEKQYEAFGNGIERVTVKLKLDGEVISSDYITVKAD